jgi:hypothetical protein
MRVFSGVWAKASAAEAKFVVPSPKPPRMKVSSSRVIRYDVIKQLIGA